MSKVIDIEEELLAVLLQEIQVELSNPDSHSVAYSVSDLPNSGSFIIYRYIGRKQDGRQVYGIRGHGTLYRSFYHTWYHSDKVVWNRSDFPWDFNTFTDEAETDLLVNWSDYILDGEE